MEKFVLQTENCWNIFDLIKKQQYNIVAVFDVLGTRNRINACKSETALKKLGKSLKKTIKKCVNNSISSQIENVKEKTNSSYYKNGVLEFPALEKCTFSYLIQDTIIIVFDIQRAIKEDIFSIDLDLLTFFAYVNDFSAMFEKELIKQKYLPKGAISAGTLSHEDGMIIGSAFIDAYENVEGDNKIDVIGTVISSSYLQMQNWINYIVPHVHCSIGEFIGYQKYFKYRNRLYINPQIEEMDDYRLALNNLRKAGVNNKYFYSTADYYEASYQNWRKSYHPYEPKEDQLLEHFKHFTFIEGE